MRSTQTNKVITVAVASDLHAFPARTSEPSPSHLCVSDPANQPGQHPISGLLALIEKQGIRADILLCPGDITHKAVPAGVEYAWQALQTLREKLDAKVCLATTGNHDVDSRYVRRSYDTVAAYKRFGPTLSVP